MSATVSATLSSFIRSMRWSKITLRWSFWTLSNLSRFLRMSKLRASTFCCAFSSALLIQGWMMASPSFSALCVPGRVWALPFFQPKPRQHGVEPVGAEDPHQIVFQRQEEFRAAGIALEAGAAAQLVVDTPGFVALRAHDVEPARFGDGLGRLRTLGGLDLDCVFG